MFELAWPWIFLLAPLPWLLRQLLPPARSSEAALQVSFLDELETLTGRRARSHLPSFGQYWPLALIWLLLLLAATRPQWIGEPLMAPGSGRDLMLAVDLSGSMASADMQWQGQQVNRLQLVKALLGDFIDRRQGDRLGLILFGSQAYLQSPLTFDRQTVATWLDEAMIGIAGDNTAIGDAIGLAVKRLREHPAASRVLLLVTDGANTAGTIDPLVAAKLAAEEGVKIYTIGIGPDPGESGFNGLFGASPELDLDEPQLKAIAKATGGQYFRARNAEELEQIGETLDQLEALTQQPLLLRPSQPLYPWPLAAALLLCALLLVRELWPTAWQQMCLKAGTVLGHRR